MHKIKANAVTQLNVFDRLLLESALNKVLIVSSDCVLNLCPLGLPERPVPRASQGSVVRQA